MGGVRPKTLAGMHPKGRCVKCLLDKHKWLNLELWGFCMSWSSRGLFAIQFFEFGSNLICLMARILLRRPRPARLCLPALLFNVRLN